MRRAHPLWTSSHLLELNRLRDRGIAEAFGLLLLLADLDEHGFRRSGLDASLGARLAQVMRRTGFEAATVLGVQGYFEIGDRDGPRMAAGIIRTLLPVLEKTGVVTPDEVDIDTLEERIAQDCAQHNAIFKPPTLVGAWARVA